MMTTFSTGGRCAAFAIYSTIIAISCCSIFLQCRAFSTASLVFSTTRGNTSLFRHRPGGPYSASTALSVIRGPPGCDRREVLSRISLSSLVLLPVATPADDENLTSKLFNPDGSLKEGVVNEAQSREVVTIWPFSDKRIVNVDGKTLSNDYPTGQNVRISYQVPGKWESGDQLYLDKSEGVNRKACNRITVYQAPGTVSIDRLKRATQTGVAEALDVTDSMKTLQSADVIGGRKQNRDDQTYFEFDLAVAPDVCGDSQKNLGLGFCPYDTIFLLSATVIGEHLYVIAVECDDDEWKQANSDLKRVRSSFRVDVM